MTEKSILIEIEDLNKFYGTREVNFTELVKSFPRLKIVARGDIIKVAGDKEEISRFEIKLQALIGHFNTFNRISPGDVKEIVNSGDNLVAKDSDSSVLLYSVLGKPIKARTKNQKVFANFLLTIF